MNDNSFKRWLIYILIFAAILRFGFLLFGDILPVMWDARRYVGASIGLISYIDTPENDDYTSGKYNDRAEFLKYQEKYIQGEQIEWLYYKPFTLTQARDEIFIAGPTYPLFMAAVLMITPVEDFTVIRFLNILLDLTALLLLMLIAYRLTNRLTAIIAGFIYALYFPFIILTSQLLLETSTTLLLLLSIYYISRAFEQNRFSLYLFSGLFSALLILNKPTAAFLFVPIALAFYFIERGRVSSGVYLKRIFIFLIPVVIVIIGWSSVVASKYGKFSLRDPSYQEANLRQSSNIDFEAYDLDNVEKDFWTYSVKDHITSDLPGYGGLLLKKAERLWSQPANEFKRKIIIPNSWWDDLHKLLIILSLVGLVYLLINNFPAGFLIFLISAYYTSIHLIFHSLSRYSLNALPILFIAAAFVVSSFVEVEKIKKRPTILWFVLFIVISFLSPTLVNIILGSPLTLTIVVTVLLIKLIVTYLSYNRISDLIFTNSKKITAHLIPLILVLAMATYSYSFDISRSGWSEYKLQLNNKVYKVGTEIYLEKPLKVASNEVLAAIVDINSPSGGTNAFNLRAGDKIYPLALAKDPLLKNFYPKESYKYYAQLEKIGLEQFRQYAIVVLNPEDINNSIDSNGFVDLEIIPDKSDFDTLSIYGNYETGSDEIYIPAVRQTSVERYVHKNDPRIRLNVKIYSDSAKSYYIQTNDNIESASLDLSPAPGNQNGRYNMFLVHFFPDGSSKFY